MIEAGKKKTMRFHRGRYLRFSMSIAMMRVTHDRGDLIGGKPGNRIPQFKKNKQKQTHVRLT